MNGLGEKPIDVEVIPATPDDEPVVANLLQLYAHDFSEFFALKLEADGRFRYDELPSYWREPDRYPFLVRVENNLAGFVLVKRGSEISRDAGVWDVAEFFVARGYRRKGIGTVVAHHIWKQFPGRWEIRVMLVNDSARRFWTHAIQTFIGQPIEPVPIKMNSKRWDVFSFEVMAHFSQ